MDKSIQEEHLSQPLQTNYKQFKIAPIFLSAYNGNFYLTNKNNKFYFMKSFSDEDSFVQITIPPGAYEIEALDKELKETLIAEDYYTQANYPFKIKPNFSTLGSIIEISPQGPIISFMFDDSIRELLGVNARTLYEKSNLSSNPVDIISFDNVFIETDIARGMNFKGKRSGITHIFTMTVNPGYKYVEKISGGITCYMMESKDIISSICFKLKKIYGNLVSFNGQSVTFRISIKEI